MFKHSKLTDTSSRVVTLIEKFYIQNDTKSCNVNTQHRCVEQLFVNKFFCFETFKAVVSRVMYRFLDSSNFVCLRTKLQGFQKSFSR